MGRFKVKNTFITVDDDESSMNTDEFVAAACQSSGFGRHSSDPTGRRSLYRFVPYDEGLGEVEEDSASQNTDSAPEEELPQKRSEATSLESTKPHGATSYRQEKAAAPPEVERPHKFSSASSTNSQAASTAEPSVLQEIEAKGATTLMLRNLPNKYTSRMLMQELNTNFADKFDFLYLPIHYSNGVNKGYAFINFVDSSDALEFCRQCDGTKMAQYNSSKVVSVGVAELQGFEANYAYYSKSRVGNGPKQARPIFLREPDGNAMPAVAFEANEAGRCLPRKKKAVAAPTQGNPRGPEDANSSLLGGTGFWPREQRFDALAQDQQLNRSYAAEPAFGVPLSMVGLGSNSSMNHAPQRRFCPHCGAPRSLEIDESFCEYCGGALARKQQSDMPTKHLECFPTLSAAHVLPQSQWPLQMGFGIHPLGEFY